MGSQKGLVQRLERKLEATVDDAFARVFGGSIVPQEIEAMLRREAADNVRSLQGNHLLAPNEYVITLSGNDYTKLRADPDLTAGAFAKHLAEHITEQGWQTYGEVVVRFEPSEALHTGQFRARGAVNPDATPQPTADESVPPESQYAFTAESGVPPMTDNPSYRGGPGQGHPDDHYDERHGQSQDDPRAGQDPRGPYPPEPGGYPAPPPPPEQGYPPHRPDQGGGYPEQGGYPPSYEQRPPANYGGGPGYEQGYRPGPGGYGPPSVQPGPPPGYGDYGRGPARHDEGGYGPPGQPGQPGQPEQRPSYPDQGGSYGQGYPGQGGPSYGQPEYGQPDYGQQEYAQPEYGQPDYGQSEYARPDQAQPDYGRYDSPAPPGYADAPPAPGYDYGQQPGGYGQPASPSGYSDYGQGAYPGAGPTVTLQLDDGSGRTYQLQEGANVVGRGQDAQFRLPDTGVSRRHLEIRWDGHVALLSDLNSTNGTTVNNSPVQEWQLADGDVVRLGHSEIVVRIH